jgi:hypothetical protein
VLGSLQRGTNALSGHRGALCAPPGSYKGVPALEVASTRPQGGCIISAALQKMLVLEYKKIHPPCSPPLRA